MRGRLVILKGPYHNTIRGTLRYTSKKPDRMDMERGREFFSLTQQSDGTSLLHAHCEIDDSPDVIRDVTCAFETKTCLLYTSPSPRDRTRSRMPSSA